MLSVLLNLMCTGFFLVLRMLAQAGSHDKPSLSAHPSPVVVLGQRVELQCDSHSESDFFKLYKELGDPIPEVHERPFGDKTLLGPVTRAHGGTYRCYNYNHQYSNELSSHSDPLKIIISGLYKKPSLSAFMGPVLMSGENVTLVCSSDHPFDMFHLSGDGVPRGHGLPAVQSHNGTFQATFPLCPVTQAGNYRCYGSFRNSSHAWSSPSDPLCLSVTEFPTPILSAATSPVVPWNGSVRIICQGTPEAFLYQLYLVKNSTPTVIEEKLGFQKEAEFIIKYMNTTTAGYYQCRYRKKYHWSEQSKPLELVVTAFSLSGILTYTSCLATGQSVFYSSTNSKTYIQKDILPITTLPWPKEIWPCPSLSAAAGELAPPHVGELALMTLALGDLFTHLTMGTGELTQWSLTHSLVVDFCIYFRLFLEEGSSLSGVVGCRLGIFAANGFNHRDISPAFRSIDKETLPKPIIWAKPSSRVPKGNPVSIWCQGPQSASEYQLYFEGSLFALERPKPRTLVSKVKFFIPQMTSNTAGRYYCFYQSGELQSEHSDLLVLVVTGMYDIPNLWVHPGPEVTLEEKVTFFCHLEAGTSKFFLLKEGEPNHVQQRHGNKKAEFPMGPVTGAHRGTYRCFGSYNDYVWSFPSEPVTLLIPGKDTLACVLTTAVENALDSDFRKIAKRSLLLRDPTGQSGTPEGQRMIKE
ncbi:natural cytotoxicity triggering receptor 1 [Cricetulus griseus]